MRVGVAGLTHGHVWGLIQSFTKLEGSEMVAVADATPLLEKAAPSFRQTYTDWREMLEAEPLDALVVTSNNVESAEIAVQALGIGIPCLVEKAMAANSADADRMLDAWRKSGKTLMINWPIAWQPWLRAIQDVVASGRIGTPFHLRHRTGHSGPKEIGCDEYFVGWLYDEKLNGGGAIADFCGYGAVIARTMLGMPEGVTCARGNYTKEYEICDDHAVCLLQYAKASATLEGTWATVAFDSGPHVVVHGTLGTVAAWGDRVEISFPGNQREEVPLPVLNPSSPAVYFWNCVETGATPEGMLNPEMAADAVRIVEASANASRSGKREVP